MEINRATHNALNQLMFDMFVQQLRQPATVRLMAPRFLAMADSARHMPDSVARAFVYPDRAVTALRKTNFNFSVMTDWLGKNGSMFFRPKNPARDAGLKPLSMHGDPPGLTAKEKTLRGNARRAMETVVVAVGEDVGSAKAARQWYLKARQSYQSATPGRAESRFNKLVNEADKMNDEYTRLALTSFYLLKNAEDTRNFGFNPSEYEQQAEQMLKSEWRSPDEGAQHSKTARRSSAPSA